MSCGEHEKSAKTAPWAYGIVRDGEQVGVERSLAVAKQWVDAEYIPLVPMQQRDELLAALEDAVSVAKDALDHWDQDREMKVGKLLHALSGLVKGYDRRADAVHNAIANMKGSAA